MSNARFSGFCRAKRSTTALGLVLALAGLTGGCSKQQADTPEQHLTKANSALDKGQLRDAEKEYREVLRLAPNDPVAQRKLAIIYLEQGQLRQSFPLLKKAADAEPDN